MKISALFVRKNEFELEMRRVHFTVGHGHWPQSLGVQSVSRNSLNLNEVIIYGYILIISFCQQKISTPFRDGQRSCACNGKGESIRIYASIINYLRFRIACHKC